MERLAIVARLKDGTATRAAELVAAGPPFDLAESGIVRHSVYLSASEVVFVFEGHQVEWTVDDLIYQPFHYRIYRALDEWRKIVDGLPRIARERFGWHVDEGEPNAATRTGERSGAWG
jgi:hypothetical protein